MMSYQKKLSIIIASLILSFALVGSLSAEEEIDDRSKSGLTGLLDEAGTNAGWEVAATDTNTGISGLMGNLTRFVLSFIGVLFMIYVIYGGFLWLTAAGNEEKVTQAKKIIRDGAIGLIVILAAAGIYIFVLSTLL